MCVCVCAYVQAYMKVGQENEEMETEQDFISDLWGCAVSKVQGLRHGTNVNAGCNLNPNSVALSNAA